MKQAKYSLGVLLLSMAVIFIIRILIADSANSLTWDVFGYYLYLPAYILIGDAYLQAANGCTEFDEKAIYWVVVDQYIKAKNVDSGIAGAANRRIATYSNYFPTKSDGFFRSIHEGSTYTLSCYPNLSTKARYLK